MAETKMELVDWLDDLCVRFIINLPHEELTSVERICFQIEEAQWFYEDFIRAQDPTMPAMNLRRFSELVFQHCPLLVPFQASAELAYEEFLAYKTRVPVRGAIMLNEDMTEVVLVKGWNKKAKWSFPRGKINKEERDLDCAIREVYEETGYDVKGAGLVDPNNTNVKYIDMSLREQQMRLYVFRDVPMDTYFEPKTRKEISKIQWFKVSELAATSNQKQAQHHGPVSQDALKASQFYMVAPFIRPLRQWIKQQRKSDQQGARRGQKTVVDESEAEAVQPPAQIVYDDGMMTTDAEDDVHFQRLLSGLQKPQDIAPLPEASAITNTADLSAQLKQMLSVGPPTSSFPQQPTGRDALLQMLKPNEPEPEPGPPYPQQKPGAEGLLRLLKPENSGRDVLLNALKSQGPGPQMPHTPLEQVSGTPREAPPSPHHHHPRAPPYPTMAPPPPAFPLSPPQHNYGPVERQNQGPPMHWQGPLPPQNFIQPPFSQQYPSGASGMVLRGNIPAPPPTQIANPLRTGDPAFRAAYQQYPQEALAPKPPPQALTHHHMNLLNVFKSPNASIAQPALPTNQIPARMPELPDDTKPILPSELLLGPRAKDEGRNLAQSLVSESPRYQASQDRSVEPMIHQPLAQKSRNAHQDSLLNLFRSAATPASPRPGQGHQPPAPPVELASQASPLISREVTKPVQHKLSMRRLPNVNTAVDTSKHSPNLTSATVTGPLNAPDFDTVKKNQPPPRPVELSDRPTSPVGNPVATKPMQLPFQPASIMQRPSSGRQAAATPPVPVHTVSNTTAMEAPRPFHPTTILRRSAQDIQQMAQAHKQHPAPFTVPVPVARRPKQEETEASMPQQQQRQAPPQQRAPPQQQAPAPASASTHFDRRDSAPQQQKNALLSLFGSGPPSAISPTNTSVLNLSVSQTSSSTRQVIPRSPAEFPGSLPVVAPHTLGHGHARVGGIGSPVSPLPQTQPQTGQTQTKRQDTLDIMAANSPNLLNVLKPSHQLQDAPAPTTARSSRISSLNSNTGDISFVPYPNGPPAPTMSLGSGNPASITSSAAWSTQAQGQGRQFMPPMAKSPQSHIPVAMAKRGSVDSTASAGKAQSPITPVEKNFLLGYLMGVVDKAGSSAGGVGPGRK